MTGEDRVAYERAVARAVQLPPEAWPVRACEEPACTGCGGLRTWPHRPQCEDCDPQYAAVSL